MNWKLLLILSAALFIGLPLMFWISSMIGAELFAWIAVWVSLGIAVASALVTVITIRKEKR
jgi:uncharacterized membrane protein YfcA